MGEVMSVQDYHEIEWVFGERFRQNVVVDDRLYGAVRELTGKAYPTTRMGDKRWFYFYVPVKRDRKVIALPFGVVLYRGRFFVLFEHTGQLEVRRENDTEELYGRIVNEEGVERMFRKVLEDALSFIPKIKRKPEILKLVPYDLREGRVKGKYIEEKLMPLSEAKAIIKRYAAHRMRARPLESCSLNEYLHTALVCYRAAGLKGVL